MIFTLADCYKWPAICPFRYYATDGGLIAYGQTLSTNIGARQAISIVF
jgi:hypothetical protein